MTDEPRESPTRSYTFPHMHRLRGKLAFNAVFDEGIRESRGPISILTRPNSLDHPRLGLSVPRRVGSAPKRNRIKRLLRESFRLLQHDLPRGRGYDLVIVVRPHPPLTLAEYQKLMSAMVVRSIQKWSARERSS